MLPLIVEQLVQGAELREMVAAAALANARTFGGEDYIGFHAFMAPAPAYAMSKETPADRRALPVLKVLYRSTHQIQSKGGWSNEVLHPVTAAPLPPAHTGRETLRDPGRTQALPGKPLGSVHGDSPGVHASDSMNAWRNIARVSDHNNAVAGLIVAGYHLAVPMGRDWKQLPPYPLTEQTAAIKAQDPASLLRDLDGAIRENDQAKAAALVQRYGAQGHAVRPVFDLLLGYAISEDGALHAEKYYRTVVEEFGRTRKAFQWSHVVGLARVTASEYGKRADGYEQACGLLQVKS